MKLALRNFGSAPETARSFTVPFTASSPIDPPGKNSGCTTNESVLIASRAPPVSSTAASPRFSRAGLRNAGRKRCSTSSLPSLPPPPCPITMVGIVGQRQRAAPVGEVGRGNFYVVSHAPLPKARNPRWPALPPTETVHSCSTPRTRLRLKPWSRPADAAACIPCRRPRTRPA